MDSEIKITNTNQTPVSNTQQAVAGNNSKKGLLILIVVALLALLWFGRGFLNKNLSNTQSEDLSNQSLEQMLAKATITFPEAQMRTPSQQAPAQLSVQNRMFANLLAADLKIENLQYERLKIGSYQTYTQLASDADSLLKQHAASAKLAGWEILYQAVNKQAGVLEAQGISGQTTYQARVTYQNQEGGSVAVVVQFLILLANPDQSTVK